MTNALVDVLSSKDAKAAYTLLQQLEEQSASDAELYPLLDDFLEMLRSDNSLVRTRGFRLAVAQARWDCDNTIDAWDANPLLMGLIEASKNILEVSSEGVLDTIESEIVRLCPARRRFENEQN